MHSLFATCADVPACIRLRVVRFSHSSETRCSVHEMPPRDGYFFFSHEMLPFLQGWGKPREGTRALVEDFVDRSAGMKASATDRFSVAPESERALKGTLGAGHLASEIALDTVLSSSPLLWAHPLECPGPRGRLRPSLPVYDGSPASPDKTIYSTGTMRRSWSGAGKRSFFRRPSIHARFGNLNMQSN